MMRIVTMTLLWLLYGLSHQQLFATEDTLIVGLYHNPPFVIQTEDLEMEGISIELWENIARSENLPFRYEVFSDFVGITKRLEYQDIDIIINPMDATDFRVARFDMTQPFFISSIGIAIPYLNRPPLAVFISNIFSMAFLKLILVLVLVIVVFGFFLWLVERKHNKYQFRPGLPGLFDGIWWSTVTMTTVGYGDKSPKSSLGKAIAIIWMFSAVVIISSFTASIASTLTITGLQTDIKTAEDLRLVEEICVVGGTTSETFLQQEEIPISQSYVSPILALRSLAKKEHDVLMYDRTILQFYINRLELDEKVKLLPLTLQETYQSFMFPKNHPHFDAINASLVREIQTERWQDIQRKYNAIGQ